MHADVAVALRAVLLALLIAGCGADEEDARSDEHEEHGGDHPAESAEQPGEHAEEVGRVTLQGVRGVAFRVVGSPIEEGVWRPAESMADEGERAALAAPVSGVVAAILVPPGREVGRGTPLLTIRSPELAELSASFLSRRAVRRQAEAEVAREERLASAGAGAARELEAARAALEVARAEEAASSLALEARGVTPGRGGTTLTLRAPKRGRVTSYDVLSGAGVEPGQQLGRFETGLATLASVELPLPGPPAWVPGVSTTVRRGDGATWEARIEGLPTSVSPETRRLQYRLRLVDGDPPVAGTPLEVRVPLPPGIVVPQDALQQIEGEWGVFVLAGQEAVFTPVRRGPELGGDVIVLAGIAPGQQIAASGAYLLKALVLKQSGGGEEHAH